MQHEPGFVRNAGCNQRSGGRKLSESEQRILKHSEHQLHAEFRHEQSECSDGSEQLCKFSQQRQLYSELRSPEFQCKQPKCNVSVNLSQFERGRPNSDSEQQHELNFQPEPIVCNHSEHQRNPQQHRPERSSSQRVR